MSEDELILTHLLRCSRSELHLKNPQLTPEQRQQVEYIKSRREQGEPLQYVLGVAHFLGFDFKVDYRVLIPRPETEGLVDEAVRQLKMVVNPRILDLGTGSGCISIALLKLLSTSSVTSVDVSQDALDVAKENAFMHGVTDRIELIHEDMVHYLSVGGDRSLHYDLVISNPPYIPNEQIQSLPKDVQQEPALALKGGEDGLVFFRSIIKYTPCLLREGGYLMMEFGDDQGIAIQELISSQGGFFNVQIHQDLAGKDRFVSAQRK